MEKRLANILLLSDKESEYQTLVNAGYENVCWFKSSLRAYEYFQTHEDQLKKFDVMLMGSRTIEYLNSNKFNRIFNEVASSCDVKKVSFFTGYSMEDKKTLFFMPNHNVSSSGVSEDEFLSVLDNAIPNELKGEVIEIPEVEMKEVVLPKERADVKVLFVGPENNNELVESVLKEAGFTNYEFIKSANFTLEENPSRLADYDLVVVDNMYNSKLSLMGDEFSDYMKDKGKNIYLAFYHSFYKGEGINRFYLNAFPTANPEDKKRVNFSSMEAEEDNLRDLIGLVINSYCSYNIDLGDGGYPDEKELDKKCDEKYKIACERASWVTDRIYELATIQRYLLDYRELLNKGTSNLFTNGARFDIIEDGARVTFKGLSVDFLEDKISVAFLVGDREAVRLTFNDEDRRPGELSNQFYIEYLSEKGKTLPVMMRKYYDHYDPSLKIDNLASDDEMKKVSAIYTRICDVIKPIVDKIKDQMRKQEEDEYKKYSKTYSESNNK